jgi:hypothetical protein
MTTLTPSPQLSIVLFGKTVTGTPAEFRALLAKLDTDDSWTPTEKRIAKAAIKAALKDKE